MNRREFLKISAVGLIQLALWSCKMGAVAKLRGKKIIVIGAGMAGLAAAVKLKSLGFEVVVLEGRARAGGRIWTDRSLGFAADMGASWIHGVNGNPITELADEYDVKHVATPFSDLTVYGEDGKPLNDAALDSAEKKVFQLVESGQELVEDLDVDVSLEQAFQKAVVDEEEEFSSGQSRLVNWTKSAMALEQAAEFSEISAWYYNEDEEFPGLHHVFPGGYGQIIDGMTKGMDIKYSHKVAKIEYGDRSVKIHTDKGSFTADGVVVTLPLGVLRSHQVDFFPALPQKKIKAISRLNMGLMNKIYLKFPKTFWPDDIGFFGYASSRYGEFPEIFNMKKICGADALVAFSGGDFARELEGLSDAQIKDAAFSVIKKMFGSNSPAPEAVAVSRWVLDGFAGGSYSYTAVGASLDDYDAIAEPVGKSLFFAGEATHRSYPATVHGAFLSGVREAERIGKLLV